MLLVARLYLREEKVWDISGTPYDVARLIYTYVGTNFTRAAMVIVVVPSTDGYVGDGSRFDQQLTNQFDKCWQARYTDLQRVSFDTACSEFVRYFEEIE